MSKMNLYFTVKPADTILGNTSEVSLYPTDSSWVETRIQVNSDSTDYTMSKSFVDTQEHIGQLIFEPGAFNFKLRVKASSAGEYKFKVVASALNNVTGYKALLFETNYSTEEILGPNKGWIDITLAGNITNSIVVPEDNFVVYDIVVYQTDTFRESSKVSAIFYGNKRVSSLEVASGSGGSVIERGGVMFSNLTDYQNGDEIPCNVYNDDPSNAAIYGRLYTWFAVDDERGICPEGWYVPSENEADSEWQILVDYLGGGSVAGGKMKATGTIEAGDGLWKVLNVPREVFR